MPLEKAKENLRHERELKTIICSGKVCGYLSLAYRSYKLDHRNTPVLKEVDVLNQIYALLL